MGFYSIYKIFKDMLCTIFGNKILKIIIIFILIFAIFLYIINVLLLQMILYLFLMFGNVDLNEWYDNYYWYIEAGFINGRQHQVRIFLSDREFSVYQSGDALYVSGNITCYSKAAGYGSSRPDLPYFKSEINISEPTLTNKTNPKFTDIPVKVSRFSNFDIKYTNGNTYFSTTNPRIINPILTNTQTELENLSFNNFNIETKSYSNQDVYMLFIIGV